MALAADHLTAEDPADHRVKDSRATVAIAHDYLTQRGGAERVVLSLAKAFPGAPIHTSLYDPLGTFPEFSNLPIRTTPLDHLDRLRQNHRVALPLLRRTMSRLQVGADVVVCSSSGWAHGVQAEGRKIVYCHNPARWLYQAAGYEPASRSIARFYLSAIRPSLRRWDLAAAHSASRDLVNSSVVRERVRTAYGIEAEVLPPPVSIDTDGPRAPIDGLDSGFLLCVSRLISYKNVNVIVDAMSGLRSVKLVVVGSGPDEDALRRIAPANVHFVGAVPDDQLRWLYANCSGLVSASYEDFGLTPVEAAAFGKPAALLRWGGFLDSLDEGTTGVYFDEPSPVSAGAALVELLTTRWDPVAITAHAEKFSEARFVEAMQRIAFEEALEGARSAVVAPLRPPPAPTPAATVAPAVEARTGPAAAPQDEGVVRRPLVPAPTSAVDIAPAVSAFRGFGTKTVVGAVDLVGVLAATIATMVLARGSAGEARSVSVWLAVAALPVWIGAMSSAGLYRSRIVTSRTEEIRRVARAAGVAAVVLAALAGVSGAPVTASWLVALSAAGFTLVVCGRFLLRLLFIRQRRSGRRQRHVLIVGANDEARRLAHELHADPALGYRVVGFLCDDRPAGDPIEEIAPVLGRVADALSEVRRSGATGVVVASSAVTPTDLMRLTNDLTAVGVHVELSSLLRDIATRRMTVRPVGRYPLLHIEPRLRGGWQPAAKRVFDVVVALIAIFVTAPVMALIAVAVRLDSRGPVLFRQRRVGSGGVTFELVKFRSMVVDAEERLAELRAQNEASWPLFKIARDPRVTRLGRLLRRTSLDELPQLFNVLRGDMSIVGPRPALVGEMTVWSAEMHARLRVRPGITGMWQVNGRSASSSEDYERLDVYYVNNWSLLADLVIIARTIPAVLSARGAY